MLAPVNVTGEQIGVHLTYLRCDGGGKATLPKEYQRECRGVIHGGAIRLAEHDPDGSSSSAKASKARSAQCSSLAGPVGRRFMPAD